MNIAQLFKKDINRHIEGVIKAEDAAVLKNELEEFVITDEIRSYLETFFENYNEGNSNGAWISGFFGSGKSHLLKILAAVIENREVGGKRAADIFVSLCEGKDELTLLKGLVERAVRTPSKSILFNIGRQADATGRADRKDTILPAFLQVFNAHCGYCEQNPAVAQFERELDEEPGHFDAFAAKFQELTGKDWKTNGRTRVTRYGAKIDEAYAAVTGSSATDIIGRYVDRDFSVDDFARLVKAYIDKQAPGFRLNFFVDEIGQYVANNTPLMLTLQSIAEALNTVCRNASWLVVTSQSNVSDVVGEMNANQGNDFSRIIGRFTTKIQLSSKNVGEVIRARLLEKDSSGVPVVAEVYNRYSGDMASIYDFADGMRKYRSFTDCDDFVSLYPFVPYQFDLFRSAMIELSDHDAFTGRFQAVGERSTLEVCQIALKNLNAAAAVGSMIPFDYWYDGIQASIKPNIKNQVHVAESQLHNLDGEKKKLAVRVLKVLLLVKYVRGDYVASPRNICSLLITDLGVNFAQLLADVKTALATLESESYVQRVGDNYEYLTDSEKDLDSEIKHVIVDQSEVTKLLQEILFVDIAHGRKIKALNNQSYSYTQMLDGTMVGRPDGDLSVNFITPVNPDAANITQVIQDSFGKDELTIVLKPDVAVLSDIQNYLKTTKYLAQNPPASQTDTALRSLLESRQVNKGAILVRVKAALSEMISTARMFVRGTEFTPRVSDPFSRITEGFTELAGKVYSNYQMVAAMSGLSDADISRFLRNDPQLPGIEDESEAERELLSAINMNASLGVNNTMRVLVDKFEKKPYGWLLAVIECLIAKLLAKGKLEASQGGEAVPQNHLAAALRNTRTHDSLILQPQTQITPQQIRRLKDFARDFFTAPIAETEAKQVAMSVQNKLSAELADWQHLLSQSGELPFVAGLAPVAEKVRVLTAKPAMALYAQEAVDGYDTLVDLKESDVDKIVGIAKGPQKAMFVVARKFAHEEEANFRKMREWGGEWIAAADKFERLRALVEAVDVYKSAGMVQVRTLSVELKTDLASAIEKARNEAKAVIDTKAGLITSMSEYAAAPESVKEHVTRAVAEAKAAVDRETLISAIQGDAQLFERTTYIALMQEIYAAANPPAPPPEPGTPVQPAAPKVVAYSSVVGGYTKPVIASNADIDDYLSFVRAKLESALAAGNKIAFN